MSLPGYSDSAGACFFCSEQKPVAIFSWFCLLFWVKNDGRYCNCIFAFFFFVLFLRFNESKFSGEFVFRIVIILGFIFYPVLKYLEVTEISGRSCLGEKILTRKVIFEGKKKLLMLIFGIF